METVRLEIQQLRRLRDYVDAQNGGPGKGWLRIVKDPFEARRVINEGKLAVIMGVEISRLFDCRIYNGVPECSRESVRRDLDSLHREGVRSMEIAVKTDTALSGAPATRAATASSPTRRTRTRPGATSTCARARASRTRTTSRS
jgi:hypothetical protein